MHVHVQCACSYAKMFRIKVSVQLHVTLINISCLLLGLIITVFAKMAGEEWVPPVPQVPQSQNSDGGQLLNQCDRQKMMLEDLDSIFSLSTFPS